MGKNFKIYKIFIFFTLVSIFLVVDFLAGYFLNLPPHAIINSYYHHEIGKPSKKVRLTWGGKIYYIFTNSVGFKDRSKRNVELKPNRYRIIFIGDSFTEGVGYGYDDTFAGIIDSHLAPYNIEILNASSASYSPKLYYLKIKYLLENVGLRFNELYVFTDKGDIEDELLYENFTPSRKNHLANIFLKTHSFFHTHSFFYNRLFNFAKGNPWIKDICNRIMGYPNFYINYPSNWRWSFCESTDSFPQVIEKAFSLAQINTDRLFELCRKHNIKMNIVVFPSPYILAYPQESCYEKFWKEFCQTRKINFVDLIPDFKKETNFGEKTNEFFITGDMHFNKKGHSLVADIWLKLNKENLLGTLRN